MKYQLKKVKKYQVIKNKNQIFIKHKDMKEGIKKMDMGMAMDMVMKKLIVLLIIWQTQKDSNN